MVTNGRAIIECVTSFSQLNADIAYFQGYTEKQLEPVIAKFIEGTDYSEYYWAADDLIATRESFKLVQKAAEDFSVVTGYCNLGIHKGLEKLANITKSPLLVPKPQSLKAYDFYTLNEADFAHDYAFNTYFVGAAFTAMSRELWIEFPFKTYGLEGGFSSDYNLSWRLQEADIPMYAVRGAFFKHLAAGPSTLLGSVIPNVTVMRDGELISKYVEQRITTTKDAKPFFNNATERREAKWKADRDKGEQSA